MFRRAISLVLLPLVMLNQSAAVSHVHGGESDLDHESRPHVHLSHVFGGKTGTPENEHPHHHGPGGHHHHPHGHQHDVTPEEPDSLPANESDSQQDHDSDAVCFNSVDAMIAEFSDFGDEIASSYMFVCDVTHRFEDWSSLLALGAFLDRPPSFDLACPLSAQHLPLLI